MNRDTSLIYSSSDRRIWEARKYKMRTLLCIIFVTSSSFVILSLTSASPISNITEETKLPSIASSTDSSSTTELSEDVIGHVNGSKLVITHIVKTLEFEVDYEDDNATDADNATLVPYIDTEIDVLNPDLLQKIVDEMPTKEPTNTSIDGTKQPIDYNDYHRK